MLGKEMKTICRLCVGQNVQLHHVFESEVIPGWTAADAIWELLRIQLSPHCSFNRWYLVCASDLYPKLICAECIKKLIDFKLFKHQCEINKDALAIEYGRNREIGDNEDVVGMIVCGNENQSEIFFKEEDAGIHIEKDPLDLSEEDRPIKSEIEGTSDDYNEISSVEVKGPAVQIFIPIKQEYHDQLMTVDNNEINILHYTSTEAKKSNEEIRESRRFPSSSPILKSEKIQENDESSEGCRNNCDTAATTAIAPNGKEKEDDPGLNITPTCKEEMPIHSGTRESFFGETSSFPGENVGCITNDSSVVGVHREGSSASLEGEIVNILRIPERVHHAEDATASEDGTVSSTETGNSNMQKFNPILDEEVKTHKFNKISSQKSSRKGHRPANPSRICFKCHECSKTFFKKSHLISHMRTHSDGEIFRCNECGKIFSYMSSLKIHMASHSGEMPFKCNECSKTFPHKSQFLQHRLTHSKVKPFQCNICSKTFQFNSKLKFHMMSHSGNRPFKCSECDKSYFQNSHLKSHLRTHSSKRPFQCNECDKSFFQSSHFKNHMMTHSLERPFRCNQCPKAFSQKSNLNRHLMIHSGDRLFQCSKCSKTFALKYSLNNHMTTHSS